VAGHPIGALLLFVGLVRLGFDDPFSLGLLVLTLGTTAVTAVMIALRAVAGESPARAATPFLVLGPAAVFVGVSADGVYMAITAWGLAALASAATSRTWRAAAPGHRGRPAARLRGLCFLRTAAHRPDRAGHAASRADLAAPSVGARRRTRGRRRLHQRRLRLVGRLPVLVERYYDGHRGGAAVLLLGVGKLRRMGDLRGCRRRCRNSARVYGCSSLGRR
jgi:hypothetical protein